MLKRVLGAHSLIIAAKLTVVVHGAKWKVATKVHRVEDFAALTEAAKSAEYLVAQRELNVLVYAICTVEFAVV